MSETFTPKRIIFAIVGFVLLGFIGAMSYLWWTGNPSNVQISNITDKSFSVSWTTRNPSKGIALASEGGFSIPLRFSTSGDVEIGYDDRDMRSAELANAAETAVAAQNGDEIYADEIVTTTEIDEFGTYYVHHATFTDLSPDMEYGVVLGNGSVFWKGGDNVTLNAELQSVPTPDPAYGLVSTDSQTSLTDGVLTMRVEYDGRSTLLTSALTTEGTWYIDLSTAMMKSDGTLSTVDLDTSSLYLSVEGGAQGRVEETKVSYDSKAPATVLFMEVDVNALVSSAYACIPSAGCSSGSGTVNLTSTTTCSCFDDGPEYTCGCSTNPTSEETTIMPEEEYEDAFEVVNNLSNDIDIAESVYQAHLVLDSEDGLESPSEFTIKAEADLNNTLEDAVQRMSDPDIQTIIPELYPDISVSDLDIQNIDNILTQLIAATPLLEEHRTSQGKNFPDSATCNANCTGDAPGRSCDKFSDEGWVTVAEKCVGDDCRTIDVVYLITGEVSADADNLVAYTEEIYRGTDRNAYDTIAYGTCDDKYTGGCTYSIEPYHYEQHFAESWKCSYDASTPQAVAGLTTTASASEPTSETDASDAIVFIPQMGQYLVEDAGVYEFTVDGTVYQAIFPEEGKIVTVFLDENANGIYEEELGEVLLTDDARKLNLRAVAEAVSYDIKPGFNFVSFPYVLEEYNTASDLLAYLNTQHDDAFYSIAKFDGSWKIVGANGSDYDANDFQIVPGAGYMLKSKKSLKMVVTGKEVIYESASVDSAPVFLSEGWNLVSVYGSNTETYTADSWLDSINGFTATDFTADNVTRWPAEKARYEGYQKDVDGNAYGFDFPIYQTEAYFVKVTAGQGNWEPEIAK